MVGGAIYMLLMALNHWETRYYFFVMVLYAGFAVYLCGWIYVPARNYGWLRLAAFTLIPLAAFGLIFSMTFAKGRENLRQFLDSHPVEILAARDYLQSVNAKGMRIVARKPHLPYLTSNEWVFFPQVKSVDELRSWVETNHVDYIAISKRELKERKEL